MACVIRCVVVLHMPQCAVCVSVYTFYAVHMPCVLASMRGHLAFMHVAYVHEYKCGN